MLRRARFFVRRGLTKRRYELCVRDLMLDVTRWPMGEPLQLLARRAGQPLALVFARDWGAPTRQTLEATRGELRGFGATLRA